MVLADSSVDIAVHYTYQVVARFHHVVSMCAFYFRIGISKSTQNNVTFRSQSCSQNCTAQNSFPFPIKTPSTSARLFSHTARRNVPPLLLQNDFPKLVRYNGPGHRPRHRRISKPEGRLARQHHSGGRACRKLQGAGSTPKNTSIALDRASVAYRHHPVKYQHTRMLCRT